MGTRAVSSLAEFLEACLQDTYLYGVLITQPVRFLQGEISELDMSEMPEEDRQAIMGLRGLDRCDLSMLAVKLRVSRKSK